MDGLWRAISSIARVFAWIGGGLILVAALIVTAEVILRKMFVMPVSGSDEIAGYLFAVGTSWSLAFVLVTRGHVRIDALYGSFPKRVQVMLDIVALLGMTVLVVAMAERGFDLVHENYFGWTRSNSDVRMPLAIPQGLWLFGVALFLLAIAIALMRALGGLFAGNLAVVQETIGIPSQQEEIKSELEGLGIETPQSRAGPPGNQPGGPQGGQRPAGSNNQQWT